MPYCTECGAEVSKKANFCNECGFKCNSAGPGISNSDEDKDILKEYKRAKHTASGATTSLVIAIIGLFFGPFIIIFGIVAIIFALRAKNEIRANPALEGTGMATAGYVMGIIEVVLPIILILIGFIIGVIILGIGGTFGRTGEQAYNLVRDELQLATTGYLTNSSHALPIADSHVGTMDVCLLLGPNELLREVPDGLRDANCYLGMNTCSSCSNKNHYEWRVDDWGNVYSVCFDVAAGDCDVVGGDGYQGIWP